MGSFFKVIVFVLLTHADVVREAMGKAGGGNIGNYEYCTFFSRGVGRFRPLNGAHPAIGTVGELESVEEEKIETICHKDRLKELVAAIKNVHPYEEVAMDIFPNLTEEEL